MSRLFPIKPREAVAVLRRAGFVEHHQKGSHLFLWNAQSQRMTTVPQHPGDRKMGTLRAIIKQAGINEEEFLNLL
ncbi:MAG: type II toxin-antitoxin system HicA family toxin [Tepidisphaeraceae bacterium]